MWRHPWESKPQKRVLWEEARDAPPPLNTHTQCGKCLAPNKGQAAARLGVGWWVLSDGQEVVTWGHACRCDKRQ